jgi:hypothetical protein
MVEVSPTTRELWVAALTHTNVEAAKYFGMGTTRFKKLCRKHGFIVWPYRQLRGLGMLLMSSLLSQSEHIFVTRLIVCAPTTRLIFCAKDLHRMRALRARVYKGRY